MIHKFKVEPKENCPALARVTIDGQPIRCRGYEIAHYVEGLPTVKIDIIAIPECEMDAIIGISNKAKIASLMDEEEFDKFCKIWREIHICKEKSK